MTIRFDEFELDVEGLELRQNGVPVRVDAVVLRLLAALASHAGQLVTKEQLIAHVWENRAVSENVITVAIARLRKTLGHERGTREFVVSVHGRGYRFIRDVAAPLARASHRGLPFVGRGRVLSRLRAAMGDLREGTGGVTLLIGEAGIGKTSVAEMAEKEALGQGFVVAWGYCREAGDTPPLWPFIQLVRDTLERSTVDRGEPRLMQALHAVQAVLPELGPATPKPSGTGAPFTYRLFDSIVRLLTAIAAQTPAVFVLDDLHRADSASLELLRYLIGEISRTRVLVVGTLRNGVAPDAPGDGHLAYVMGHRNTTRLVLGRLEEPDVRTYVNAVAGERDDGVLRSVFRRSEGNPFFMAECARLLKDSRDTVTDDGEELPALSDAAMDLPRQRLSALDAPLRDVLSTAAVIGNSFDLALLAAVSGVTPERSMESIDRAVETDVVVRVGDSKTTFRFAHDLLRAVLHDGLDKATQRALHLRVVDALVARMDSGGGVAPGDLAYHSHSALPDGDPRRVVDHCRAAATAAAGRRAYGDAVRYSRHAREALELVPNPSQRLRLALLLQHALYARVCSSRDFEPAAMDAIRLARDTKAAPALARAALMLDLHPGFPALPGARAALEEARDAVSPEDETLPALLARLATGAPTAYDAEESSKELARAAELALRANTLLAVYPVRSAALYLRGGPLHLEHAAQMLRELESICEAHSETLSVAPALMDIHLAIVSAQSGKSVASSAALERAIRHCRGLGHHELEWHGERFRLLSMVNAGQLGAVSAELCRHHRRAERESLFGTSVFVAHDEAVLFGARGSFATMNVADPLATRPDDTPNLWAMKVRALAAAGRHDDSRRALHRLTPAALGRLPCDRDYLGTLGALARASIGLEELEYLAALEKLLAPYPDFFALGVSFLSEGPVRSLIEAIAAARRGLSPEPAIRTNIN